MKDKAIKSSFIIIAFVALVVMINNDNSSISLQRLKIKELPPREIILLGERHSGTNWITEYLIGCFQDEKSNITVTDRYSTFKHWFQTDDAQKVPKGSAVVVVMFRDPYAWVEAMRVEPHHSHNHIQTPEFIQENLTHLGWREQGYKPLEWKEFVTKPWIGKTNNNEELEGLGENKYEMQHDGSGRAYSSIIDLRRDKIINHLSVANFVGTRAFLPMRYEDLNTNGTAVLLKSIEEATGIKANCSAIMGKGPRARRRLKHITKHAELSDEFIDWMNKYVDWEVESRIGYYRREVLKSKNVQEV